MQQLPFRRSLYATTFRREMVLLVLIAVASIVCPVQGFSTLRPATGPRTTATPLWTAPADDSNNKMEATEERRQQWRNVSSLWKRLDTLETAGIKDVALTSGAVLDKIKSLHNPKFYLGVAALAMLKWKSLFRNYLYWFVVAFLVKWYRARYVFKIPVWDRQPNWNNVITSKEQEKDLKAFTCKKCGSTIFIAKSREFFFEGGTGIGGLGCFSCGAKGKENFVMDRERIVEDVADEDDYFDYESPLDFVSRAERKKLLKETGGDEAKANQILLERTTGESPAAAETPNAPTSDDSTIIDAVIEEKEATPTDVEEKEATPKNVEEKEAPPKAVEEKEATPKKDPRTFLSPKRQASPPPSPAPPKKVDKSPPSKGDDEGLDALDMDDF